MRPRLCACLVLVLCAAMPVSSAVFYVDGEATGLNNGASWENAHTTIQAGVDAAYSAGGGEVWVKSGTYTGLTSAPTTDSFEARNANAVDVLGEESHMYFDSLGGGVKWAHLTAIRTSGSTIEKADPITYEDTSDGDRLAKRLSEMLSRRPDVLVFANHPDWQYSDPADLAAAANARALHGIELQSSDAYVAAWDYVLANLDDQSGACNKIVWGMISDDSRTSASIGATGFMMGCIPTAADYRCFGISASLKSRNTGGVDRRLAFRDMVRRGSMVCLRPGRRCGMPTYTLESNAEGKVDRMTVGVQIYGGDAPTIKFFGCSPTSGAAGTLLRSVPASGNSYATGSYYFTTTGAEGDAPLTAEQKAAIRYIRVEIAWTSTSRAMLQPVRIKSNGCWWDGPDYTPAGAAYVGPSPYPPSGPGGGETVYFNTNTHSFLSDGELPPWVLRQRYWDLYGGVESSKPRFCVITDDSTVTPFAAPVRSIVTLKEAVKLYGGFAGTESARSERNPAANPTIIDAQGQGRCVYCDGAGWSNKNNAVLDGFVLSGGDAGSGWGGGVFCKDSKPAISGCVFNGNSAAYGGGMCSSGFGGNMADCSFTGNTATEFGGGAFTYMAAVDITRCGFTDNSAVSGGALWSSAYALQLAGCSFERNSAAAGQYCYGGAVCSGGALTVSSCNFASNEASGAESSMGGAIASRDGSATIATSTFTDNAAQETWSALGGAVWLNSSSPNLTSCRLTNNTAVGLYEGTGGAIMLSFKGKTPGAVIAGNLIADNSAISQYGGYGGGLFTRTDSKSVASVKLVNNTFASNTAALAGAVMFDSAASFTNNVVAFNSSGLLYDPIETETREPSFQTNCVHANTDFDHMNVSPGASDVSFDPEFVDVSIGDYHLKASSHCIDAGTTGAAGLPSVDMDWQPRICGGAVEIGADELAPPALSPGAAKGHTAGAYWPVALHHVVVTVRVDASVYYVESLDRSSGIRVIGDASELAPGDLITLEGYLDITSWGERYLVATRVIAEGKETVKPVVMRGGSVGGGSWLYDPVTKVGQPAVRAYQWVLGEDGVWRHIIADIAGANTVGLLVKVTGIVTKATTTPDYKLLYIDDGSRCDDYINLSGLRVLLPVTATLPAKGDAVTVVGVLSCWNKAGEILRQLIPRSEADVVVVR